MACGRCFKSSCPGPLDKMHDSKKAKHHLHAACAYPGPHYVADDFSWVLFSVLNFLFIAQSSQATSHYSNFVQTFYASNGTFADGAVGKD